MFVQNGEKNGYSEAKYYPKVSVLFSDFVGFTFLAERLTPQELVAELDYCFKRFDRIIEHNKIEKIKTIGDAYMAAGGVPVLDNETHVQVARAALEMQEYIEARKQQRKKEDLPYFEARVG
ncbi:MAG TPA: adenylate/guanylate cyclase domain-containing protein, partial [Emticicia sp.]